MFWARLSVTCLPYSVTQARAASDCRCKAEVDVTLKTNPTNPKPEVQETPSLSYTMTTCIGMSVLPYYDMALHWLTCSKCGPCAGKGQGQEKTNKVNLDRSKRST